MAPHERHWSIGTSMDTVKPALRKPAQPVNQNRGLAALRTQLQVVVPRAANRIVSFPARTAGSTVAIDNKIEQAMDLVKSHLMYAVREEVEVLKERIAELLDRISVLETENSILKASAPQEVLAELSSAVEDQHYNSQSSPAPPQGPPSSNN